MPLDFSGTAYLASQNTFARTILITPTASKPADPTAYRARGIWDTASIDIVAMDGSIISESKIILDILEAEFSVLPAQGDTVEVPADGPLLPLGSFEIINAEGNGYETTLTLRRLVTAQP